MIIVPSSISYLQVSVPLPTLMLQKVRSITTTNARRLLKMESMTLLNSKDDQPVSNVPRFVYGTAWKKERTTDLVSQALQAGFVGIDTAAQPKHYQENLVGDGMRRALENDFVTRENLYVCHCVNIFRQGTKSHSQCRFKPSTLLRPAKIPRIFHTNSILLSKTRLTHR